MLPIHKQHLLRNFLHRRLFGGNGDMHRVVDQRPGQRHHVRLQGRGEKERLPFDRQLGDDLADVANEPHVEHPVGFVEHKDFNAIQTRKSLFHQIEQPTRCSNDNIHAVTQGDFLRALTHAAKNHRMRNMQMPAVGTDAVADLGGEFACWREHQHARTPATGLALVLGQILQNGKREGGGLARARLCTAQDVTAREQRGNGLHLNRRGCDVTFFAHRPLDFWQ